MRNEGYLLIADISGYTDFIRLHNMRTKPLVGSTLANMFEAHADKVIRDLLEAVIEKIEPVMQLNKLEGDAAFFFCPKSPDDFPADKIFDVMTRAHEAFNQKSSDLVFVQACGCDPCLQSKNLRLKIVAHKGTFSIQKIRNFEEVTGEDVILAHRLLKNSLKSNEYWLVTDPFLKGLSPTKKAKFTTSRQNIESFGKMALNLIEFRSPDPKNEKIERKLKLFNYLRPARYFMKPSMTTLLFGRQKERNFTNEY